MSFPIPIQPNYDANNAASKNATEAWISSHNVYNVSGGYITQSGQVLLTNTDSVGTWQNADVSNPVPAAWLSAFPNIPNPQYWAPSSPSLPNNLIYQYVTVWGSDGNDIIVLNQAAQAALLIAQQTVVEPPVPSPAQSNASGQKASAQSSSSQDNCPCQRQ